MIINSNNKDSILKGTMKRGFNQTPKELKDKILNEIKSNKTSKKINETEVIKNKNINLPELYKMNQALNKLRRLK